MSLPFRHKAIYGQTGTGKTWLMKRLAKKLRKYKQKVIVWSGSGDIDFPAGCKITLSIEQLESWLKDPENFGSHVMIDEGAVLFKQSKQKDHPVIHSLFSMGRHKGYTGYIATQYPTSIPYHIRVNCAECYCFRLGAKRAADQVYEDYNCLENEGKPLKSIITALPKLHCLHIIQPDQVQLMRL